MDITKLQQLKTSGFIFGKYTGEEKGDTFEINGEVLMFPSEEEVRKAGADYFSTSDKLKTIEEMADLWISKNETEKIKVRK